MKAENFATVIETLSHRLKFNLPGVEAHARMAPTHRKPLMTSSANTDNYKIAAVLALLVPNAETGSPQLVLIERSVGPVSHSGQISFPGGKREGNEDLVATALREANEELGIQPEQVVLLGALTSLYIPPSNFLVHPFLGYMSSLPDFILNEAEVKRVLLPPLTAFLEEGNISMETFISTGGQSVQAPNYTVNDVSIWGATAMMIAEISALLKS